MVDVNNDGTLNSQDLQVVLTGVTSLTAADLGLVTVGNAIDLTAAAAVVNGTTQTNATNVSTNANDTITASIADLVGSTVNGLLGTDTLTIGDAGVVAVPAGFTNIETLVLANGVNNVSLNAAGAFSGVTGGTGADTLLLTNLAAGGAVNLGAGVDIINGATEALIEGTGSTFEGGADNDILNFAAGLALTTGTLDLSSVSGFETINFGRVAAGGVTTTAGTFAAGVETIIGDTTAGNLTVNMTAAQMDALKTVTSAAAAGAFVLATSDTGAVTVNLADTVFTTLANVAGVTFASASSATVTEDENVVVTGTTGADVLNVTADLGAVTLASTGFETINTTSTQTGLTIAASATTVNATGGGVFTLGTGGDTFNSNATVATAVKDAAGSDTINQAGTGALGVTLTADAAADTVAATGTGAVTVNAVAGGGTTAVNLNAANGAVDTVNFADGGGGVGVVASTDLITVTGFNATQDKIGLDIVQTTAGTAATALAVVQLSVSLVHWFLTLQLLTLPS